MIKFVILVRQSTAHQINHARIFSYAMFAYVQLTKSDTFKRRIDKQA